MNILQSLGLSRRTLVMGVLNVTPDSFSDGGKFLAADAAINRGLVMLDEGADMIDVGGESTRPATFQDESPVDPSDEMARILPVIEGLAARRPGVCISVDTYKSSVAGAALRAGANVLNDISAMSYDPKMAQIAARSGAPIILMHMPGAPRRLPESPEYGDLLGDICDYFRSRVAAAISAGVSAHQIVLDPGIGFGKSAGQNLEIIRRLSEIKALGFPVLSGPSRKSFLGKLLGGSPADDRLEGTAAAVALSIAGGADIVRVHDVRFMARLVKVCDAVLGRSAT